MENVELGGWEPRTGHQERGEANIELAKNKSTCRILGGDKEVVKETGVLEEKGGEPGQGDDGGVCEKNGVVNKVTCCRKV